MNDYNFPKMDLVDRLETVTRAGPLCKEAADEIRRLRAENEMYKKHVKRLSLVLGVET